MIRSSIVITHNFEDKILELRNKHNDEFLRIFELEELCIEDSHNIIKEANIISKEPKYIAIFASSYNIEAQNALLKIIEEPPFNIIFLIYTSSRNKLLKTLHSRMQIIDLKEKLELKPFPLDVSHLHIGAILEFIKEIDSKNIQKEQSRILLYELLDSLVKEDIKQNEEVLNLFFESLKAINARARPSSIFLPLLLALL